MTARPDPDDLIRAFLDEGRTDLPDRAFDAIRRDIHRTRQRVVIGRWKFPDLSRIFRMTMAVAAVLVVAMTWVALAPLPGGFGGPAPNPTAVPQVGVAGTWEATDIPPDYSHLTMEVIALPDGTYDVTMLDEAAMVCDGTSSTLTGIAEAAGPGTIVIEQPVYACDDGSIAQVLSGPPLEEQLADLTFVHDPVTDEVQGSLGLTWTRVSADPSASPRPSGAVPHVAVGTWAGDGDEDGGHQVMDVIALPDGTYDTTTRDDVASVCGGTPSTMTGIAEAPTPGTIVIAQPVYVCDDGSEAQSLSGPPLEQLLRDLSFVHDPIRDELQDSFGMIWTRVEEAPSASPAVEGTPSPTPSPAGAPLIGMENRGLEAGTYRINADPSMSVTMPAGWSAYNGFGITKDYGPTDADAGAALGSWTIVNRYLDGCTDRRLLDPAPGPGIDDLIEALASQPGIEAGPAIDVTVDGYHGKAIELTLAIDIATCPTGFWLWGDSSDGRYLQGNGEMNRIYVLDVDGVRRTFFARFPAITTAVDRAELEAIIESVKIDP